MNILIRQASVQDPASPFHQQTADLFIQHGIVADVGTNLFAENTDYIVDVPGLVAAPGWVDVFAQIPDPGFEYKETLETGAAAAAAGGFTDVFSLPNTSPVLHNKAAVEYVVQKSRYLPVSIHPIGAATKSAEGKELAEMYDMRHSGAIAFGDGTASIQSPGIMLKALQYLKAIDGVLIQVPEDRSISTHGLMNESVVSTRLGLAGKPAIAEELMILRDLELVRYTASKIHFTGVSTARSLDLIRKAKNEGLPVTCSVTPQHLLFTEEDLETYDTAFKVSPPFRSKKDREALRNGVLDGMVDCIATHHQPHEKDSKVVEFEYAQPGIIGLETALGVVCTALPQISVGRLVELFSTAPRRIFDLPMATIIKGGTASITLFHPFMEWKVKARDFKSLARNTPFEGMTLKGKPIGIINKDRLYLTAE